MEDFYYVEENIYDNISMYMICDGHGGDFVSRFCIEKIPALIKVSLQSGMDCVESLYKSIIICDSLIPADQGERTGSCCLILLRKHNHLWIANVGDCRAIIGRKNKVANLTKDHKPVGEEQKRIIELGGIVTKEPGNVWRVSGVLAVSRALGDKLLRPYVTSEPDIFHYLLDNQSKYIILASDGLWDIETGQEINKLIEENYQNVNLSDEQALTYSRNAVESRIIKEIEDNTTVIMIHLRR